MPLPSISVIIPTFNRRQFVGEAVASVLAQRGVDAFELIVVDDGSTDGTADSFAAVADRVTVISQPNRGVSSARNAGAQRARGGWLAFLDSDDLWLPDKLAVQSAFVRDHPEVAICQTEEVWMRNGVRVNPRPHQRKPHGDIFTASLERCLVAPSAVMMRRDLFERAGGFDERLPACEDYDLWLRVARDHAVPLIDQALVIRRGGHPDQLSYRYWGMDRFRVPTLARLRDDPSLTDTRRCAVTRVLNQKCAVLAGGAAKRGRHDEARHYLHLGGLPGPSPEALCG